MKMDIEKEIHEIKISLAVMEERYTNDAVTSKGQALEFNQLSKSVRQLILVIENDKGFKAGVSTAVKTFRIIVGSLVFISVVSLVTITISNMTDITSIKEQLKAK